MDFEDSDDDAINELLNSLIENDNDTNDDFLMSTQTKSSNPQPEHMEVLLKYFAHKTFRPMQWEIISAIINNQRDVCAVMSTGYGKSLCYQYPSTFLGGVTLVVSPLIALMEDQVLGLEVASIPACLLGTAQKQQSQVIKDIFENKYNLVYLTPELCTGDLGRELLKKMSKELKIVLIAIDEAHCISSWGHDFRFQYRKLGFLHDTFPQVPIIAVTATATPKVRGDIVENLHLRNPLIVCSGFDRPNIYFEVHRKSGGVYNDLTKVMVKENSCWKFSGPTIVYCITRKDTEEISQLLNTYGIKSVPYHAGLHLDVRTQAHELFVRDKVEVIVATIAFGMGINKPDIRNVVHYGSSKSIESYYQEVGRAGRDGHPAKCVSFFSTADFTVLRHLNDHSAGCKDRKEGNLKNIEDYLWTRKCRRRFILEYFEDQVDGMDKPRKICCDNCTNSLKDRRSDQEKYEGVDDEGRYDFTDDGQIFVKAVLGLNGKYGLTLYLLFLKGSKSSRLTERQQNHPMYGAGKHKSDEWWKAVAKILIQEKYLQENFQKTVQGFSYKAVTVTNKGQTMLTTKERLLYPPPSTILPLLKKKPQTQEVWLTAKPISIVQPSTSKPIVQNTETKEEIDERMALYRKLLDVRTELASQLDCMPYMIASNATLMGISRLKPQTLTDLRRLNFDGLTEAKITKFGTRFLKVVNGSSDGDAPVNKKATIKDILSNHPLPDVSLGLTAEVSCTMLQSGLTVGEIAVKRGVTPEIIASHLISGIKFGHPIKMIELGVGEESRDVVVAIYRRICKSGFVSVRVKQIKDLCPLEISNQHIQAVLAYLQVRCHLEALDLPYEEFEDFPFSDLNIYGDGEDEEKLDRLANVGSGDKDVHSAETQSWDEVIRKEIMEDIGFEAGQKWDGTNEPQAKRVKADDDVSSILDSPPRQFAASQNTPVTSLSQPSNEESDSDKTVNNVSCDSETVTVRKQKKGKALPPWLTVKKIN